MIKLLKNDLWFSRAIVAVPIPKVPQFLNKDAMVVYVGNTIVSKNEQKNQELWVGNVFVFYLPTARPDSQCYSLYLEHLFSHETTRLPLEELLYSPCYKRSQAPP